MRRWSEPLLDALLAVLVISSILMSLRVWYPPVPQPGWTGDGPTVQPSPPEADRQLPDIFRPEQILIRVGGERIAALHAGTGPYKQVWPPLRTLVTGLWTSAAAFPVDQVPERLADANWIRLHLPVPLTFQEWADHYGWKGPILRNGTVKVDRILIYLAPQGVIYLSGPANTLYYLGDLNEEQLAQLQKVVQGVDPALYAPYRRLATTDLPVRPLPGLLVPERRAMPIARVRIAPPDEQAEESRHFPDLSVLRQIDERDAISLTDGQRLLRLTHTGMIEFRTADSSSSAPDLNRALVLAQEWIAWRGGWPQEIVLRRYMQQPGRTRLEFEYRSGGPLPVESAGGAFLIHASLHRVIYALRYPSFVEMTFGQQQAGVISPEEALARAVDQVPMLLTEPVRSMHLAYRVQPAPQKGTWQWELEPSWVILAGEARVYVGAAADLERSPVFLVR